MKIRETIARSASAATYGLLMGVAGVAMGVMLGLTNARGQTPKKVKLTDKQKRAAKKMHLLDDVRRISVIRRALEQVQPVALPLLADAEFNARRQLEELGYYPCPKCAIPHLDAGKVDCLPAGTYWHEELQRYIEPDHPDWTVAGYEAASGQPWDDDTNDDPAEGGPQGVH